MSLVQIIPFKALVWCVACRAFSDASGQQCPACGDFSTLLNVARILQPDPRIGQVTFVHTRGEA